MAESGEDLLGFGDEDELDPDVEKLNIETAAEVGTACHLMLEALLKNSPTNYTVGDTVKVVTQNDGTEHARLSPSGAERWTTCPGSVVMVPKMVESQPVTRDVVVTQAMMDWVITAGSWVWGYLQDNPDCVLYSEVRAFAGVPFRCPDDMWGTSDVVIINRRKLELVVADAKFGYVPVDPEENKQLLLYAIGVTHDFAWSFKTVKMVILQPRDQEHPVKTWVISQDHLHEEMERLRPKVERALQQWSLPRGKLDLVPTDEGCKWCEAAPVCPALQQRALQLARREFADPELLTHEQFMTLLNAAPMIVKALSKVRQHAMKLLELGQPVPGWKRVRKNKRRIWKDPVQAGDKLVELGVPEKDVWKREVQYTPAQAEKLVKGLGKELLQPFIDKPVGEPVLAPETDKRLALAADFEPC